MIFSGAHPYICKTAIAHASSLIPCSVDLNDSYDESLVAKTKPPSLSDIFGFGTGAVMGCEPRIAISRVLKKVVGSVRRCFPDSGELGDDDAR